MKNRYLLCKKCLTKIRIAEALYKRERRLKIKEINKQVSGKIKINN
jgi:hypothetical protein